MADTSEDKRERLTNIWTEWGLQPDTVMGDALLAALDVADEWLEKGASDPETVIRAVQVLLVDPERPDVHRRPCWGSLRRAIRSAWGNAMTAPEHVFYGQALILAAWSEETQGGWFRLVPLVDSAWDLLAGRERQRDEMTRWREGVRRFGEQDVQNPSVIQQKPLEVTPYATVNMDDAATALAQIGNYQTSRFDSVGPYLFQVLTAFSGALSTLSNTLQSISGDMNAIASRAQEDSVHVRTTVSHYEGELSLLWWGQARYCQTLQKPFRRIQQAEDVVWWAAREAAERARVSHVESAAAYLVETLHDLGHNVFERRPLLQWMEHLYASLKRTPQLVPALSERLVKYAREDALGLPVTWVRLQAARNEPLEGAANAVALDLKAEIDRGQWASWIFRECLLDLHLAGDS